MAFNQPIEADNPDLDHLTTFSQAPILGTIMWLLGGDMTLKLDGEKRKEPEPEILLTNGDNDKDNERQNKQISTDTISALHDENNKHVPDRILSDISEGSAMEDEDDLTLTKSFDECTRQDQNENSRSLSNQSGFVKRMSWSDESGQSLVEYSNEVRDDSLLFVLYRRIQQLEYFDILFIRVLIPFASSTRDAHRYKNDASIFN